MCENIKSEETSYWPYKKNKQDKSLKIAFITLILPGLPGKSGGEIRDGHILGYLSSRHDVDVYSINNFHDDVHYVNIKSNIRNLYYPEMICRQFSELVEGYKEKNLLFKIKSKLADRKMYIPFGKFPFEVEGFMSTFEAFTKKLLQQKLLEENYDVIMVTPQVNPAFLADLQIPKQTKSIFATYDVEKIRYNRLKKTHKSLLTKLTFPFEEIKARKMERKIIQKSSGVIAVSELDRQVFIKEYNIEPHLVLSIENGVDTTYFYESNRTVASNNIVYVGNMGYPPNSQAVEFFVSKIMPLVLKKNPNVVFWAVGANANEHLRKLDNGLNVHITGEVPDVRTYLDKADVVCIPLQTGSGTKYKVLEALSSSKPVITSSIGAEGISVKDGEELFIRDKPSDIADAILYCFENKERVMDMGKRGREFVLNHHEWKIVLPKIETWLQNHII